MEDLTRRAPLPVGDVKKVPLNSACDGHDHDEELVSSSVVPSTSVLLSVYYPDLVPLHPYLVPLRFTYVAQCPPYALSRR